MKLASLKGGRDGRLLVVSRDLSRAADASAVAATLREALDDWAAAEPRLQEIADSLEAGRIAHVPFDPKKCAAPLPRSFGWADGSAYVNHVALVRKSRGAEVPPTFWTDPLMYRGASDEFIGPCDPICAADTAWGIDLEAEVAVVVTDVPQGVTPAAAGSHIKLFMLLDDISFRNLIPGELAKGFGFLQGKGQTSFSPVAVTPDELGDAWDGGKINLPLTVEINGAPFGKPEAGVDMTFDFPRLLAHITKTRNARAGTILGSGTISNYDRSRGSACLAERRTLELLESGKPVTPFLKFGDRVRIEMLDAGGKSIFGAIDQRIVRA